MSPSSGWFTNEYRSPWLLPVNGVTPLAELVKAHAGGPRFSPQQWPTLGAGDHNIDNPLLMYLKRSLFWRASDKNNQPDHAGEHVTICRPSKRSGFEGGDSEGASLSGRMRLIQACRGTWHEIRRGEGDKRSIIRNGGNWSREIRWMGQSCVGACRGMYNQPAGLWISMSQICDLPAVPPRSLM